MGCNSPNGPQRLGPSRFWNLPSARRSNHVYTAVDMTIALMTKNASRTAAIANASHSKPSGAKPTMKP